jgi:hypothetical protein
VLAASAHVAASLDPSPGIDWRTSLEPIWHGLHPSLPYVVALWVFVLVLRSPLPGRGPTSRHRDPWRTFRFEARHTVLARAGHRCEAALLVVVGRCRATANEVDHVYPWSKGGATAVPNGQALCRAHNRAKSDMTPPWWYVLLLERRRRRYFPAGVDVRVSGAADGARLVASR